MLTILATAPVEHVVVYATALTLAVALLGRAFHVLRRASRLLDLVERLPGWMKDVDEERAVIVDRLDEVENITQAIGRDLGIPARRRPQGPRRAASQ